MTEQPNPPDRPGTADESPEERSGNHADRPGPVRTQGETAVDDALGSGDDAS